MQVSLNLLRYGRGRPASVPLQRGLAAAVRAAAVADPPTAVATLDFLRYTESLLADAASVLRSGCAVAASADRCTYHDLA